MLPLFFFGVASVALAAPPTASVTSVLFSDVDLDRSELGGTVSWTAPSDISQVLTYNVYLATDALGGGRVSVGSVAVGTNQVSLGADTALGSFTYLVVMTANGDGEQANTPGSTLLADQVALITGLSFNDKDLDISHIGGRVSWQLRGSAPVTGYKIYTAASAAGLNRALLGDATVQHFDIVADTAFGTNSYICVYPVSSLGESSQPSSVQFYDVESPVRNLDFHDLDLDADELGGQISWLPPMDTSEVTQYVVTSSTNSAGAGRGSLGTAASGATAYALSADTAVGTYTHISVYSRSSLAEASTPVSVSITDVAASASGVTFTDTDQDVTELGGTVSWTAPADTGHVTGYALYMATSAAGTGRSNRIGVNTLGLSRTLNANTNKGSYTHFTVYTRSSLTEQSTPASLAIIDAFTSTTFCDTFTCPAEDFNRGAGTLCMTGVCDAATCCQKGCRGTPTFFWSGFAPAPSSCTDMLEGSSCTMQCESGWSLWCPTGGTTCNTFSCRSGGGAYLHQAARCMKWTAEDWGLCSEVCGVQGTQTRSVRCDGGPPTCAAAGAMPATQQSCLVADCGCREGGRHDPMRPWGRNHSMSCDAQWWVIFWIIIGSSLLACCCLAILIFLNMKKSGATAKSATQNQNAVEHVVRV